jgi:hypothetical protein
MKLFMAAFGSFKQESHLKYFKFGLGQDNGANVSTI